MEALAETLESVEVPAADGVVRFKVIDAPVGRTARFGVAVRSGRVSVAAGRALDPADAMLSWRFADLAAVWSGELSVEEAYMSGRVTVDGDRVLLIDGWRSLKSSLGLRAALRSVGAAAG